MRLHSLDPGVVRLRPHPDIDCGVAMVLAALLASTDAGLVLAALLATPRAGLVLAALLATACANAIRVTAAFAAATAATTTAGALGHD
jgi:hypothetical protein